MSGLVVEIPADYGYVILVFVASIIMLQWLGARVGMARKKYEVKYPKMYTEPYSHVFNCIQRAHQNTQPWKTRRVCIATLFSGVAMATIIFIRLEGYSIFLVLLLVGGILYPKLCAASGVIWIASRVVYAMGYYTGDPERRRFGAFGYIGLLIMLVVNVIFALKLLGLISS